MDITHFFDASDIWPDTNGDGYPDDLGLTLSVDSGVTDSAMWAGILNLTARLAFETTAFSLPVVCTRGRKRSKTSLVVMAPGSYPPGFNNNSIESHVWQPDPNVAYLVGDSAPEMARILNQMAYGEPMAGHSTRHFSTPPIDLLHLAGEHGIYGTTQQRPRSRILIAGILLETPTISHKLGQSLAEMAAMMSLGATEITLPIADCKKTLNHEILFVIKESSQATDYVTLISAKDGGPQVVHIQGDTRTLPNALKQWIAWAWADSGPGSKNIDRFREQVATVQRIVSCKAFAGQNDSAGMTGNPPQTILKNTPQSSHPAKEFSTPPVEPGTDGKIEDHTVWTGEIAVILDLASRIPDGIGKIHGMILLSKPEEKRKYIKNMLEERFRCQGYDPELIVLNAYKPGLSWLLEGILPELKCRPDIARLDIFYKPFIGMDGALELRSRWLQELFPAAELIAGQLGLETDHVCFTENPDQPDIYRIQAISSLKEVLIDQGFSPRWSRMMYLDGCPDHGYVHPTTGGIRLWHDDKVILDQPIPTDREMFWQIFQKNWLPTLMESMQNRHIKSSREHALAFWENIRFSVWIEETDEALGIGEERICPMEALHEDIYFVLLAAFAHFSQTCSLPDFLQLGRIMPKTYSCLRGKNPSARLVAQPMVWPADVGCEAEAGSFETRIKGLLLTDTSIRVDISILSEKMNDDKMDELIAELYSRTYRADRFPGHIGLWLKSPVHQPASDFRRSLGRVLRWVDTPPANRLLPYSEVHDWLKRFTMVSHLSVWRAANSYRKKPVWAVEAVLASRGKCVSIPKLRLLKPTIFCNARHHANEISSTPACLITAWTLATTLPGQEWLRHVNMVFVPIENPDGVATLEEMLPQGSGRKLHAARYNALGSEYYSDYFRNPPRFPEAAAKSKLWKRWLPEIMIDHHGVPSHEWDQPFSGYAPHGFQEYWIPRTFVYAHIPFSDRTDHPLSETARGLATIMKDVLTSESDIVALNQEIAARYQRYARAPQPDVFPPTSPEPLLVYPLSERSRQTNFAIRYPNITRSDIVVEVPDEIASGEMLERCVRAHRKIQEAAILFLRRPKGYVYKESDFEAGTLRLVWK